MSIQSTKNEVFTRQNFLKNTAASGLAFGATGTWANHWYSTLQNTETGRETTTLEQLYKAITTKVKSL